MKAALALSPEKRSLCQKKKGACGDPPAPPLHHTPRACGKSSSLTPSRTGIPVAPPLSLQAAAGREQAFPCGDGVGNIRSHTSIACTNVPLQPDAEPAVGRAGACGVWGKGEMARPPNSCSTLASYFSLTHPHFSPQTHSAPPTATSRPRKPRSWRSPGARSWTCCARMRPVSSRSPARWTCLAKSGRSPPFACPAATGITWPSPRTPAAW